MSETETPPLPTPQQAAVVQSLPIAPSTPSEAEYQHLISYFKWLVGATYAAILILVAVVTYVVGKSLSDVKVESQTAITDTKNSASQKIAQIGTDATVIAKDEAQKAVERAFEKGNVQQLIERVARERVDAAVDKEVDKNLGARIEQLQKQMGEIGEVSNDGARLRLDFRSALDALVAKSRSSNHAVSDYAHSTLVLVGSDYETRLAAVYGSPVNIDLLFQGRGASAIPHQTLKDLMNVIKGSQDLALVTAAFMKMREVTGTQIQVFDIPAAEKWCAQHKPRCE
jgi:citrate lyase gamma subunit